MKSWLEDFYKAHISIILGLFLGIMAGQLSSNTVLAGLKHSIIFMIASMALFIFIIQV